MRARRDRQKNATAAATSTAGPRALLVVIAGGSGSGKSWLADKLERALPSQIARVSLDDFYLDRSYLAPARRAQVNFDHPRSIDWNGLARVLEQLLAMRAAGVPCYDFASHSRLRRVKTVRSKPIVLLEGLWALRRASIRRKASLSIFLDCPAATRLRRRLARDLASRGRTRSSVRRQFAERVQPMHERYIYPQRKLANLVFRGDCGPEDVRRLTLKLGKLLFEAEPMSPLKTPN